MLNSEGSGDRGEERKNHGRLPVGGVAGICVLFKDQLCLYARVLCVYLYTHVFVLWGVCVCTYVCIQEQHLMWAVTALRGRPGKRVEEAIREPGRAGEEGRPYEHELKHGREALVRTCREEKDNDIGLQRCEGHRGGQPPPAYPGSSVQPLTWGTWDGTDQGPPPLPLVDPGADDHGDHIERVQA